MSDNETEAVENSTREEDNTADLEPLIDLVRNQKVIYNLNDQDYKNAGKKELIWLEIAAELNRDVKWCKGKWKYLRDNYKKKKKALKGKSGDAAKRIKKWTYFDLLSFLDLFTEDAETTGNIKFELDVETLDDSTSGKENEVEKSLKPIKKKQKISGPDEVDKALIGYLENQNKKEDIHHHFALTIAERLREMPPQTAAFTRLRIEQVLYEIQFPQYVVNMSGDQQ